MSIHVALAKTCRSLDEMDSWKATKSKQFLLYSGPIVLKGVLCEQFYKHFVLLFVDVYCLVCPVYCIIPVYTHMSSFIGLLVKLDSCMGGICWFTMVTVSFTWVLHWTVTLLSPLRTSWENWRKQLVRKPNKKIKNQTSYTQKARNKK